VALKEKLSISLDRDVLASVRKIAGEGRVSEWLNDAALLRLQGIVLDTLAADHGPLSPDVLVEVEASWPKAD